MASTIGTHVYISSPQITVTIGMSTKREGKSIYARWRAEISALTGAEYPYSITGTIVMNEYRLADAVVFKNAYPGAWTNPIIKYFPSSTEWSYVGDVTDPSVTTMPVRVRFVSSAGNVLHMDGEESIPPFVLPTSPTSVSASVSNVGYTSTNFTLSWSGQVAGTGEITGYFIQYRVNSGSWYALRSGSGTSSTINLSNVSNLNRGDTVYFRVAAVDEYSNVTSYSSATDSVYYSELPNAPSYVSVDTEIVSNTTDNFTLSWSGASADVGSITSYVIYYLRNGTWTRLTTATGYSATINLSSIPVTRGDSVSFSVTAISSLSLESDYSSMLAEVQLAKLPTAPTWISVTPTSIKRNDMIDVTWGGATAGTGEISYYTLQYRHYHAGYWTGWTDAVYRSTEYCHCEPTELFPTLQGGDRLDVRVGVTNTYDLRSESYAVISSYVTVLGGGIRINVNGVWYEGTPYVNVNGTWKIGETFVNVNGNWHEGI